MAAELNVTERPWVARHLTTPESMASSPRRRPLIYIYDLPAEFNTRMHQYRLDKVKLYPMHSIKSTALWASYVRTRRCPDLRSPPKSASALCWLT